MSDIPTRRLRQREATLADRMDRVAELAEAALLARLAKKLEAKRTIVAAKDGIITDQIEVDDHAAQLRALDMALTLRSAYPAKELALSGTVHVEQLHQLAVEFAALPVERLTELVEAGETWAALPPADETAEAAGEAPTA